MNYERTGFCFYRLQPIEGLQPGGRNPRHVRDRVPYRECMPALLDAARRSDEPVIVLMPEEVECAR